MADIYNPGPWNLRFYGQNGYEVVDANGVIVEHGKDSYDPAEDQQREEIVVAMNRYVAETLGKVTDAEHLSDEFFRRRRGLTPKRPILPAVEAKQIAAAYRKIDKPLIADAISGVRYGKKLLRNMRKFQWASDTDLDRTGHAFTDFGVAQAQGYFGPEDVGTSTEELRDLYLGRNFHHCKVILDIIRSGQFADESTQYTGLISVMNLAGVK